MTLASIEIAANSMDQHNSTRGSERTDRLNIFIAGSPTTAIFESTIGKRHHQTVQPRVEGKVKDTAHCEMEMKGHQDDKSELTVQQLEVFMDDITDESIVREACEAWNNKTLMVSGV